MNIDPSLLNLLSIETPNCEGIELGKGYASFILTEESNKIYNGVRSEIAINYPFTEGDTVEYSWAVMLPEQDIPGADARQWWVLAQWHDQPDPKLGETWATFKPKPPPLAIYVEKRNGLVGIGVQGLNGKKESWVSAPTGTWLVLRMRIRWSTGNDGYAVFSVDGRKEFSYMSIGRNMLNNFQHYFKVGQYRKPGINKYSVVHVRDVQIKAVIDYFFEQ